jgi:hypothetical protein
LPGFEASSEPVGAGVDGCGDTARAAAAFFECFGLAREGLAATVGAAEPVAAGVDGCGDTAGAVEALFECFGLAREGLAATVGAAAVGAVGEAAGAAAGADGVGGAGVGVGVGAGVGGVTTGGFGAAGVGFDDGGRERGGEAGALLGRVRAKTFRVPVAVAGPPLELTSVKLLRDPARRRARAELRV